MTCREYQVLKFCLLGKTEVHISNREAHPRDQRVDDGFYTSYNMSDEDMLRSTSVAESHLSIGSCIHPRIMQLNFSDTNSILKAYHLRREAS